MFTFKIHLNNLNVSILSDQNISQWTKYLNTPYCITYFMHCLGISIVDFEQLNSY